MLPGQSGCVLFAIAITLFNRFFSVGRAAIYKTNSFHMFYSCSVKVNIALESEQRSFSNSKFLLQQNKKNLLLC